MLCRAAAELARSSRNLLTRRSLFEVRDITGIGQSLLEGCYFSCRFILSQFILINRRIKKHDLIRSDAQRIAVI